MHTCPMVTVLVPHVGGPILPPGAPTVLIGFLPAATVTNMVTCVGPPDIIVKGSAGVFINFLPAARMGDMTAHGGVIILGEPTVMIGEIGSPSPGAGGLGGIVAGLAAAIVKDFNKAIASVYAAGTGAIDALTAKTIQLAAQFLAGKKSTRAFLLDHSPHDTTQLPYDGKVIGSGCQPTEPGTVATAPGVRPAKCPDPSKTIPKVYFANGINTKFAGDGASMCATMQNIANQTCAEVVGIYGATEGMLPDLDQAVDEISKTSDSKQVSTLTDLVYGAASKDPPDPLNLIVHSRGGLATQEALDHAKSAMLAGDMSPAQVSQALSKVNISAYGTAVQGWPVGPVYSKLNNVADPVPAAMKGAQSAFQSATNADNDPTPTGYINEPQLNPINAHSLDSIYAKYMPQAPGPRDCNCS